MKKKKLSLFRLSLLIIFLVFVARISIDSVTNAVYSLEKKEFNPWFAGYVDVTAKPRYEFENIASNATKNLVLSFIVSSVEDPCVPTWGTYYTLDEANIDLDLDRRIERVRQQEGNVVVSFGGQINNELSIECTNKSKLKSAYLSVINRYNLDTIDLDIEGSALSNTEAINRSATVIAEIQTEMKSEGKSLAVWLTLPVTPNGLTIEGANTVTEYLASGVDLAGVNVMTMNYGQSKEGFGDMKDSSISALKETHRQLGIIYKAQGINLNDLSLWKKIGATPMIGQNDIADEVFTLEHAKGLNQFALSKGVGRMSMWSANRDIQCGGNYVHTNIVSNSCSGVEQDQYDFSKFLGAEFEGSITQNSNMVTVEDEVVDLGPDIPEESPYQIWNENGTYLQGTKVVWKRNVYEAKWWTQGDIPDNPVLQAYETPWTLIGPVLPGEKPIPQPTLPAGTFPEWEGKVIFEEGDIVLFDSIPYKAKWWTQGDSPAAASSDPNSSPWKPLTRDEIEELLN